MPNTGGCCMHLYNQLALQTKVYSASVGKQTDFAILNNHNIIINYLFIPRGAVPTVCFGM